MLGNIPAYTGSFLVSINARFYKELDREMLNKRQAIKTLLFENSSQSLLNVKMIARQVARNVAQCNIPDHATQILKMNLLQDKLHSATR